MRALWTMMRTHLWLHWVKWEKSHLSYLEHGISPNRVWNKNEKTIALKLETQGGWEPCGQWWDSLMRIPSDYTGYHVNYLLQNGWNGYGKLNLVVMIIMPILQYGWNGYGILNLFTLVIMPTLMKSFHWKNGMVKMDKMEYGPLNWLTTLKEYMEFPRSSEGLIRRWVWDSSLL